MRSESAQRNRLIEEYKMNATAATPPSAETIRKLHSIPLFSVNGTAVNRGSIEIGGLALPPRGDPSLVQFEMERGVRMAVDYPLPNPGAHEVYWYWPDSLRSAFRITIDLAASNDSAPFYKLRIKFLDRKEDEFEVARTTVLIPKDLRMLQNFPSGGSLQRVMRFDTVSSVALTGLTDANRIATLAKRYGWNGSGNVLDWGCGHGRVVRHLHLFAEAERFGIDIDPENVGWAKSHLPDANFRVGPLMPPTDYENGKFSLIYAISVMTHLTADVQIAWLREIKRLLQPGGLALLTFAGDGSAAFSSRYLTQPWFKQYLSTGSGPDLPDKSLEGVIDKPDYYKNVTQKSNVARDRCAKLFEVVGVHECMFGYQDLLVLRNS